MRHLFLVRHGETEWSRDGRHTSTTDLALTARGERQAAELAGHLDPADFALALTSPLQRAHRTAELAGWSGTFEPEVDGDLAEWRYGDYEGRTSAEIQREAPGWTIFTGDPPGGETAGEVTARVDRLIRRVRAVEADQAICFAHGHLLRALAVCWLELPIVAGTRFPLETGTVSILGYAKGVPAVERWNAPVNGF